MFQLPIKIDPKEMLAFVNNEVLLCPSYFAALVQLSSCLVVNICRLRICTRIHFGSKLQEVCIGARHWTGAQRH